MTKKDGFDPNLWKPRGVEETQAIYDNWADSYDADVTGAGYLTPSRLAAALADALPDKSAPILDFGCGTGLSGTALMSVGFTRLTGTDINESMLAEAHDKGVYEHLYASAPGTINAAPGDFDAITATGVVSLGAAPPDTLSLLLDALAPGGLLAFSYNDATLADQTYLDALTAAQRDQADPVFEEYGPHLTAKEMGSTVYILRRR